MHTIPAAHDSLIEVLGTSISGVAALAGVVALAIAIKALSASREAVAVDQLFAAFSELIGSLQGIERAGQALSSVPNGEAKSRSEIGTDFARFLAARARVDLATHALGLSGPYSEGVLDIANNLAAGVLQAEEFGPQYRDPKFRRYLKRDSDWKKDLSWTPKVEDFPILEKSIGFREVVHSKELVDSKVKSLQGLDRWWGERITEPWSQDGRSVYSVRASYLTQTSRLLADFTREYVQEFAERSLATVAKSKGRRANALL